MRNYIIMGLVLALVAVGGYIWVRERSIAEKDAKVAVLQAELDSVVAIVKADSAERVEREAAHQATIDSLDNIIEGAESAVVDATLESDSLAKLLRGSLSPELRVVLDSLVSAHGREREGYRTQLLAIELKVVKQDSLLNFYRDANDTLQDALTRSLDMTDYWREKSKRSPWEKPWFSAATAVGGAGLAILAFK